MIVLASVEKYTVGLDLYVPLQNVLCCVFGFEGISGKIFSGQYFGTLELLVH